MKGRRGDGKMGVCTRECKVMTAGVLMTIVSLHRLLVGSERPSMLMLIRSAEALATMRPVLLLRELKKAARR